MSSHGITAYLSASAASGDAAFNASRPGAVGRVPSHGAPIGAEGETVSRPESPDSVSDNCLPIFLMSATSLSIEPDDLELSPFNQRGGLGKAHQLFGEQLPKLLDELNEVLAA